MGDESKGCKMQVQGQMEIRDVKTLLFQGLARHSRLEVTVLVLPCAV